MSLKVKLTSTIAAFLLILGLTIMGVFAAPTATIQLGGSLNFKATDVHAQVDGTITGSKEALADTTDSEDNLETLNFNNNTNVETEGAKWSNHNISFKDDGSTVTILIKITNLASDRVLYASVNDSIGIVDNVTKTMKRVTSPTDASPTDYDGTLFEIPAKPETGTANVAYVQLTMTVTDPNASLPEGAAYGYVIELKDTNSIQNANTIENLTFAVTDEAKKEVSVSMKSVKETTGEIVIPSYLIIDETTGEATMASASSTSSNLYKVTTIADCGFFDISYLQELVAYAEANNGYLPDGTLFESEDQLVPLCVAPITSVVIPNSVQTIGKGAFQFCSELSSVVIGDSVTSIDSSAFYRCSGLQKVLVNDINKFAEIGFAENNSNPLNFAKNIYLTSNPDTALTTITLNTATKVGDCAFYGCSGLTSVVIGDSVTNIGASAFFDCTGLTSIIIPNSVTSIGASAFPTSVCAELNNAYYLKDNNEKYTYLIKAVNTSIKECTISDECKIVADRAFYGCTRLTSVVIGDSVTSIGASAFDCCTSLTSITIPGSVTSIGSYAFFQSVLRKVIIDSEAVASGLASKTAMGYLINYANEVYIKTGLAVGSYMVQANWAYINEIAEDAESEYAGYTRYATTALA